MMERRGRPADPAAIDHRLTAAPLPRPQPQPQLQPRACSLTSHSLVETLFIDHFKAVDETTNVDRTDPWLVPAQTPHIDL